MVVLELCGADSACVRGLKIWQVPVYRASFSGFIGGDGFAQRACQPLHLSSELPRPRSVVVAPHGEKSAIVFEGAVWSDVEWTIGPAGMETDHATRPDSMADA